MYDDEEYDSGYGTEECEEDYKDLCLETVEEVNKKNEIVTYYKFNNNIYLYLYDYFNTIFQIYNEYILNKYVIKYKIYIIKLDNMLYNSFLNNLFYSSCNLLKFNSKKKKKRKNKNKPDLMIRATYNKVDYLDEKVKVWIFPVNVNEYKHIYNKQILYYKHVCNKDLERRHIEPYNAYICYLENGKRKYETISFITLYNILTIKYNKYSIINHIYDITYNQFDISGLI